LNEKEKDMATTKARFYQAGDCVDYTPSTAKSAGDVIFGASGSRAGVVVDDIAANEQGALRIRGNFAFRKDSGTFAVAALIGWDSDGTGVDGVTGGAATSTAASIDFVLGRCIEAASGGATEVKVGLNEFAALGITNSTAGTASTTLLNQTGGGTNYSIIDNNFATIFTILQKFGMVD
jgi:predicted RecA/RadA family phage recombinase